MNYSEVRKLVKLVEASDIQELEFEREGSRICVKKGPSGDAFVQALPSAAPVQVPPAPPASPQPAAEQAPAAPAEPQAEPDVSYHEVKSPMVGTFYRAPAPDADPYVQPGSTVKPGQTVCMVEAMKLMNEIECDVAGTVVSVEVENARPVEFGQVLFKIDSKG